MTIQDILVSVDETDECIKRLKAASYVADVFDSHVTGLFVKKPSHYHVYGEVITPGIMSAIEQQQDRLADQAKQQFETHVKDRIDKSGFITAKGHVAHELVYQAVNHDIVIVGQSDSDNYRDMGYNPPEQVALESGRPALIIPYIGYRDSIGKHILIAWNNGREATRAVHDALPFLKSAESVTVLAVNHARDDILACAEMGEHLARHDVQVEIQEIKSTSIPVADCLLSRASELDIDLLVMGAYGHSRFREYALGGVTRTILKTMTVPVLLSH